MMPHFWSGPWERDDILGGMFVALTVAAALALALA